MMSLNDLWMMPWQIALVYHTCSCLREITYFYEMQVLERDFKVSKEEWKCKIVVQVLQRTLKQVKTRKKRESQVQAGNSTFCCTMHNTQSFSTSSLQIIHQHCASTIQGSFLALGHTEGGGGVNHIYKYYAVFFYVHCLSLLSNPTPCEGSSVLVISRCPTP